jgi:predicted PurR-regulated permease PerM
MEIPDPSNDGGGFFPIIHRFVSTVLPTDPNTGREHTNLRRLLIVSAAAIMFGLLPFASGLVGALMLAALTGRIHQRLVRRMPVRIAALLIVSGVLVLLVLPGVWLSSTLVSQAQVLLTPTQINQVLAWTSHTPLGAFGVVGDLSSMTSTLVSWTSGKAITAINMLTSAVINVFIALFGLYYMLLDSASIWERVKRLLPVSPEIADALRARFVDVTDALVLGTLLVAALQGALVGVGFAFVGLEPALLWGVLTAGFSVLPVMGSAIVWLPAVVFLFANHRPGDALLLLAIGGGIASNIDNLMRPLVYKSVSGIHPMLALVGGFAGAQMFGLIGLFLGPLILSYFIELLDVYDGVVPQHVLVP